MSNKKPLLTEKSISRLMKLANLGKHADNFIKENYQFEEEQPPEMGGGAGMEPAPEEASEEPSGASEEDVKQLVMAIADAIESQTGVSVEVEGETPSEEPEMDEPAAEQPAPEGGEDVSDAMLQEADDILGEMGYKKHSSGKYYKQKSEKEDLGKSNKLASEGCDSPDKKMSPLAESIYKDVLASLQKK